MRAKRIFFNQDRFYNIRESRRQQIQEHIDSQTDEFLRSNDIDDYAADLAERFAFEFPEIDFDNPTSSLKEETKSVSAFDGYSYLAPGQTGKQKVQVVRFHHAYSGDLGILQWVPSSFVIARIEPIVDPFTKSIEIEIVNHRNNGDAVKAAYQQELDPLKRNFESLRDEVIAFNAGLKGDIAEQIRQRIGQLDQQQGFLASLNVPLRSNPSAPATFSVPRPKLRDKITVKPVESKDQQPEPALDAENYRKILRMIHDIGRNFERLPSVYTGKQEEDLRDFILFVLDPNFEMGSATGETFNKTGKTDILLRYNSGVVFVAECKFWKGEKAFHKTLDQLLGYLTWRNSKTALINFVKNRAITPVLDTIKARISDHPCHKRLVREVAEGWDEYIFTLPGDPGKEIELAVISFHLP